MLTKARTRLALIVVGIVAVFGVAAQTASAHSEINFKCLETPATANPGAPSSALLSMLAALRRPLMPNDHLELPMGDAEGVYVNYIRLARVVAGTSYYLFPVARPNCSGPEELYLEERAPGGTVRESWATAAQIAAGDFFGACCQGPRAVVAGVVSDGVAKVSFSYPKSRRLHPATISTKPVENVFVVTVPRNSTVAGAPRSIVWRSATGRVIKVIHGH